MEDTDNLEFFDKAILKELFAIDFLKKLAQEIGCETDPDFTTIGQFSELTILGSVTIIASLGFIGKARKGWVGYIDSARIHLHFPMWRQTEVVCLEDPKSFERLEKIFHDENWRYLTNGTPQTKTSI